MPVPLALLAVSAAASAVKALTSNPAEAKARKTSQDFEAMFLEQTLERMFASSGAEGPLGDNGAGGSVYRSMLVKEYAGNLAKSGGVGIGDGVYREMLRMQESSHAGRI